MLLTWGDWLRFIVTPLVLAAFTAIVATRNAKKTPHERLKNLVDIRKNMPDDIDSRNVVDAAIRRELVDFDRRVAADQRGLWAGMKERYAQFRDSSGGPWVVVVVCVVGVALGLLASDSWADRVTLGVGFGTAIVLLFAGIILSRNERRSLQVDHAAAAISQYFPRVVMQDIAGRKELAVKSSDFSFETAGRLEGLGVLERLSSSASVDGSERVVFSLTPFGESALAVSLAEADRRHIAKWEDIAREVGERGEGTGSEATGS